MNVAVVRNEIFENFLSINFELKEGARNNAFNINFFQQFSLFSIFWESVKRHIVFLKLEGNHLKRYEMCLYNVVGFYFLTLG